jgi:hypothetical protein
MALTSIPARIYTETAFVKCMHCLNRKIGFLALSLSVPIFAQTPNPNALTAPAGSQAYPSSTTPQAAKSAWAPNAIRQNVDLVATGVQVPFQPWAEKVYKQHTDNLACRA